MHFIVFMLLLLLLTPAVVVPAALRHQYPRRHNITRCGVGGRNEQDIAAMLEHEKLWKQRQGRYASPTYFNVVFNVISDSSGNGDIPTPILMKQISVLNTAYAGGDNYNGFSGHVDTKVRFRIAGINRYTNDYQFNQCGDESQVDASISAKYRVSGNVINIYTCALTGGLLGYAFFPCASNSYQMYLRFDTMKSVPGVSYSNSPPYDGGDTMTHEIGHNLGLMHPFQGGCSTPGDAVADTPEEASPYYGACPPGSSAFNRDSCPSNPGNDLIQDFMDYSEDICMDRFTVGQADRMQSEMDRCGTSMKNAPRRCVASGTVGTASEYSTCYTATCRFDAMPNGQSPPSTGWCYTYGGTTIGTLWGSCMCLDAVVTATGTTPTLHPSLLPTKHPTTRTTKKPTHKANRGTQPTKFPTKKPSTKGATSSISTKPFSSTVHKHVHIPDDAFVVANWAGTACVEVPVVGKIASLDTVIISASHSWIGDLIFTIETSEGYYSVLMDRPVDSSGISGGNGHTFVQTGLLEFVDHGGGVSARTMGTNNPACGTGNTCPFNVWGGNDMPAGTRLSDLVGLSTNNMWVCAGDRGAGHTGTLYSVTVKGSYAI